MYETHFGFNAPPFQINPDPAFYFDSRGHHQALAHLRYGLQQGEGFIVITGGVGTGKTTLVRALLQQLDSRELVAAQLANTQLDAQNLLQSILTAFGVPAGELTKAALIARLEAFLTSVAASGRRALLVVDEAQNLTPQALEELRMLSNFQLGSHGLLQSFLVGQPKLRQLLQLPSMEQLRERVLASYHLGPLDVADTAAYVVHRLQHVGWNGQRPAWPAEALARLHGRCGGVPRRINVLCNRLLLAAYLGESAVVSPHLVDEVADEMGGELGLAKPVAAPQDQPQPQPQPQPQTRPQPQRASAAPAPVLAPSPAAATARPRKYKLREGALLAVAGDALAWSQLQMLCRAWAGQDGVQAPLVMVHPGASRADIPVAWRERDTAEQPAPCAYLECPAAPEGRRAAALAIRFTELVAEVRPKALLVAGSSFDAVHLTLLARQLALPVIRLAVAEPSPQGADGRVLTSDVLDRCADLLCVPSVAEHQRLLAQGLASWRVARVSPMTADMLRAAASEWPAFEEAWATLKLPASISAHGPRGFGLITAQVSPGDLAPADLLQWLVLVRHAHAELPLVWLAEPATAQTLAEPLLHSQLIAAGIALAEVTSLRPKWALLAQARCLISGPGKDLVEEAQVLGVPSVVVHLQSEIRGELAGSNVAHVGPSRSQFMAAVRAASCAPRVARNPAALDDAGVKDVIAQIRRWLDQKDALPFQLHPQTVAA